MNVGVSVVVGIDNDKDCEKTYEFNNKPAKFIHGDLTKLDVDILKKHIAGVPKTKLLFVACAPCQPFSQHRRGEGPGRDGTLLMRLAAFVKRYEPGQLIVENVPGLAKVGGYSTYHRFRRVLEDCGYKWDDDVLDAKDYGVPQTRRRFILIATKGVAASLPERTHGRGRVPYVTVRNAIADIPPIGAGETHLRVPNHRASAISPINLLRLKNTPSDGGGRMDWDEKLVLACHKDGYEGHSDVYGRMAWDKPAPTLTCRCHSISNGRYGHPVQHRAISLREAARLQTFKDGFVFFGPSKAHLAKQIGNAVPVLFAEQLAAHVLGLRESAPRERKLKR